MHVFESVVEDVARVPIMRSVRIVIARWSVCAYTYIYGHVRRTEQHTYQPKRCAYIRNAQTSIIRMLFMCNNPYKQYISTKSNRFRRTQFGSDILSPHCVVNYVLPKPNIFYSYKSDDQSVWSNTRIKPQTINIYMMRRMHSRVSIWSIFKREKEYAQRMRCWLDWP